MCLSFGLRFTAKVTHKLRAHIELLVRLLRGVETTSKLFYGAIPVLSHPLRELLQHLRQVGYSVLLECGGDLYGASPDEEALDDASVVHHATRSGDGELW